MLDERSHIAAARWEAMDESAVVRLLLTECTVDGLAVLAQDGIGVVRRAAVMGLGLRGTNKQSRPLIHALRSGDTALADLAEHALWQIWMRAGTSEGDALLRRASGCIRKWEYEEALHLLDSLCALEPMFAEAHHQRGIVLSFLDRPREAAAAFRNALRQDRCHFHAAANLGHMCVELGDMRGAFRYYRYALRLNPRLEGLADAVKGLEPIVGQQPRCS